jgi:TPR repeat protein
MVVVSMPKCLLPFLLLACHGWARAQAPDAAALRADLEALATRANGGNAPAALELANRLMATGDTAQAARFYEKAAAADTAEAQEKLALILLDSKDPSLWPEGHSWLARAIAGGSVPAREKRAEMLLQGSHGLEPDLPAAIRLLQDTRRLPGAKESYFFLGNLARQGIGMPKDGAIALAHFQEGAQAGSVRCLVGLHQLLRDGVLVPKDLARAEAVGKQAAQLGDPEAAYQMAIFEERFRGAPPDWETAAGWLRTATERGHGGAATRLASYRLGASPAPPDPEEAVRLLRLAADLGDAEACWQLSRFYGDGTHLPKDAVAAAAWCRVAAERGFGLAQNEFGVYLVAGFGVTRDPAQAAQWFLRAAQREIPAAFVNLGELHEHGYGLPANPAEALRLYRIAAEAGFANGQVHLARLLRNGTASPSGGPDPVEAAYWAREAAAQEPAHAALAQELREALTPEQATELDRRPARPR